MSTDTVAPIRMSMRDLIGQGYDEWFYNLDPSDEIYKNGMTKSEWAKSIRFWVVKGGRGSKKSYTIAYWILINLMHYDKANVLVVRKVADTLADSCYALLEKCAWNLGIHDKFKFSKSPLKIIYRPTGQQIIFRGLDNFQKLTSLDVTYGSLCWMWIEEAYQIANADDFHRINESIRGKLPDGLFKRVMLSFNPWNKTHWLRTEFFETDEGRPLIDPDVFAHTTNYLMNEWLDDADYKLYDRMKRLNPRQYLVAGLGNWGSPEGLIYDGDCWEEFEFDFNEVAQRPGVVAINGLDFGISADPTAMCCMLYDDEHHEIYVYDEIYVKGYTSPKRYQIITQKGYKHSTIYYDEAGALDSRELMDLGLSGLIPYHKAGEKNSILNGINFLRSCHTYIHPRCVNFLVEIENYMWYVDKDGNTQNKPQPGSMDHLMDAWRYGVLGYKQSSAGGFIGSTEDDFDPRNLDTLYGFTELTDEEREQRKKDVAVSKGASDEEEDTEDREEDDDDDGLSWCYSTS